ncbi:shikimate dehydrogenase [Geomicrobium halophilum]|uniref:Shikimate dehydrogenase (NADP(+)) n=1 Tax=Geomicrobium halophilum TaxID=549000 RepID=A0A841PXF9_9BACL|nr:shikimate dehydrogenase [Geomicrobium halophilum]MBB6448802.1 shikimate dehydrogenase [Geomicrobium halophilum]
MENYAVIGHPIKQSKSPMIHNKHFEAIGRNAIYTSYEVFPEQLDSTLKAFKTLGITGFNVTIPHKVNIIPLLDVVDDEALEIGAVNTVVNLEGRWHGYNTDGRGYLNGLLEMTGEALKNMNVLVIGAGGAARAVTTVLAKYGVEKLAMTNRTTSRAEEIRTSNAHCMQLEVINRETAVQTLDQFDLIINTTSLGMKDGDALPIEIERMNPNVHLSDLIYNPLETRWLQTGKLKAKAIQNGLPMFIEQAALAYEIWTNDEADRQVMSERIRKETEKKNEINQ